MSPSFAFLVGLWVGSAFAPGALDRQLAAERGELRLPLDFARAEARQLTLVFHQRGDVPPAAYEPAAGNLPARLAIYSPHYLRGGTLRPLLDLTVELCQPYLQRSSRAPAAVSCCRGDLAGELRRRASQHDRRAPAYRVDAYLEPKPPSAATCWRWPTRSTATSCPALRRRRSAVLELRLPSRRSLVSSGSDLGDDDFPCAYFERARTARGGALLALDIEPGYKRFLVARVLARLTARPRPTTAALLRRGSAAERHARAGSPCRR